MHQSVRFDPHAMQHGGMNIDRVDCITGRLGAMRIGGAIDLPALDAAAGQHRRSAGAPMITPGVLVDSRSAAEFAKYRYQSFCELAALIQVVQQRGETLI